MHERRRAHRPWNVRTQARAERRQGKSAGNNFGQDPCSGEEAQHAVQGARMCASHLRQLVAPAWAVRE